MSFRVTCPAVLLVALLLAGCAAPAARTGPAASESQPPAAAPKRIVAAIMGDPHTVYQTLNPASRVRGIEHIQALVAGQLTREGEGLRLPELAEQVPAVDNGLWKLSGDGTMETTWRIKPGVEWHDGAPFTSQDLLFTAQVVRDQELPIFGHSAYQYITEVIGADSRTITVRWSQPYIDADAMFGSPAVPYPAMELVRQGLDHSGARSIHSRNTPLPENNFRVTGNRPRYYSAELDSLIDRYYTTIPLPDRRETMGQIVKHLSENPPFLQQLYTSSVRLVNNRVLDFKADGPWNSHEWDVTR